MPLKHPGYCVTAINPNGQLVYVLMEFTIRPSPFDRLSREEFTAFQNYSDAAQLLPSFGTHWPEMQEWRISRAPTTPDEHAAYGKKRCAERESSAHEIDSEKLKDSFSAPETGESR